MKMSTRAVAALVLATALPAALPGLGAGAAHASGSDAVIRTGSCSVSTDWKIKAKPDDGRIEVEAEIDSNVNAQKWRWVLKHDGAVADRGTSRTKGPSGSFGVERRTDDNAGTDRFKFRAVHKKSGEVCVARLRL